MNSSQQKETVLITGANSFIARHLATALQPQYNVKLLTRSPSADNEYGWDLTTHTIDLKALDDVDHIIHLAGSKLNDGTPLTPERQKLVYDTRVGSANFLRQHLIDRKQHIKSFISASAVGYYSENQKSDRIAEDGANSTSFPGVLCRDWELAADQFVSGPDPVATRCVKLRVGFVFGLEGGIYPIYDNMVKKNPQLALAQQQQQQETSPWVHIDDIVGMFKFAVQNENFSGTYNTVAPGSGSVLNVFQAIAQDNDLLSNSTTPFTHLDTPYTAGPRIVSDKIIQAGYHYKHPTLGGAIKDLVAKQKQANQQQQAK